VKKSDMAEEELLGLATTRFIAKTKKDQISY